MRHYLVALVLMTFSFAALADCSEAYKKASDKRNKRNLIIVGVVAGASGAAAIGGGAIVIPTFFFVGSVSALSVASGFDRGGMFNHNNFNKLQNDFSILQADGNHKHLYKIISAGLEKAGMDSDDKNIAIARGLMLDGYNSMEFCPLVKIRKNGEEKRAVFTRRALIKYISENI